MTNRLALLHRSPGYAPHPYEQLAENHGRLGHDADARRSCPAGRALGYLLDATVGYRYRPWIKFINDGTIPMPEQTPGSGQTRTPLL